MLSVFTRVSFFVGVAYGFMSPLGLFLISFNFFSVSYVFLDETLFNFYFGLITLLFADVPRLLVS